MRTTVLLFLFTVCTLPARSQSHVLAGLKGTAVDVDINGRICVLDEATSTMTLLSKDGGRLGEVGGTGWEDNQFDAPRGLWARNSIDIFVADYGNHRIQRFDRNLNYVSTLFTRESSNPDERFGYPSDVALSRQGDLYICDTENSRILKISGSNRVERWFGGFDAGRGRLTRPRQVEIGPADRMYVLDGKRVVVFDAFGNFARDFNFGFEEEKAVLFADTKGLLIVGNDTLYWLDGFDRLALTVGLETLVPPAMGAVRGMAVSGEMLYILMQDRMAVIPDPRIPQENVKY